MTTAAPEILKLTLAGQSVTVHVTACGLVPVGQFPEVEFVGLDTASGKVVAIRVPQKSADRQLSRFSYTYEDAVGATLTFSRDPNPSAPTKPYWGINLSNAPSPTTKPAVQSNGASNKTRPVEFGHIPGLDNGPTPEPPEDAVGESPARAKLVASFKLYDECFAHALKIAQRCNDINADVQVDICAVAATLFIQANR
jgi:hypothetical protein